MAGWDEGNVFYSDQNLEDNDDIAAEGATRHTSQRKFKEFIRSYGEVKGPYPYRYSGRSSVTRKFILRLSSFAYSSAFLIVFSFILREQNGSSVCDGETEW